MRQERRERAVVAEFKALTGEFAAKARAYQFPPGSHDADFVPIVYNVEYTNTSADRVEREKVKDWLRFDTIPEWGDKAPICIEIDEDRHPASARYELVVAAQAGEAPDTSRWTLALRDVKTRQIVLETTREFTNLR